MDKKTILIVDDENGIRDLLGMSLAGAGYNPILCENSEQAISHINEADLILTDLNMSEMNGVELVKLAKRQRPELPVIIMTGTPQDVPSNHLADQVIEKPFRFEQLKKIIADLLK